MHHSALRKCHKLHFSYSLDCFNALRPPRSCRVVSRVAATAPEHLGKLPVLNSHFFCHKLESVIEKEEGLI